MSRSKMQTLVIVAVALAMMLTSSQIAQAEEVAAPGWQVVGRAAPTNLPPGGKGRLKLYVYDVGAAATDAGAVVTVTLPEGLTATESYIVADGTLEVGKCTVVPSSSLRVLQCRFPNVVAVGEIIKIYIAVDVGSGAVGNAMVGTSVSGGGALTTTYDEIPVSFGGAEAEAGFSTMTAWLTNRNGTIDTQAGSHPYMFTTAFALNDTTEESEGIKYAFGGRAEKAAGGRARNINVNLPPGVFGNPQSVPQCPRELLDVESVIDSVACPADTLVGVDQVSISGLEGLLAPVWNMVPPPGVAAEFAFNIDGNEVFIDAGVRTGGDNGITVHTRNLPERDLVFNTTEIWGVPSEASHNAERCHLLEYPVHCAEIPAEKPLLSLGTSCGSPLEFSVELLGTWEQEHLVPSPIGFVTRNDQGEPVGLTGCERLQPFDPEIAIAPDTSYADTPAGLSVDVKMPQGSNPEGFDTPGLKGTTVVLPEGIAINPGQATGLVACQPSEEAFGTEPDGEVDEGPVSCPSASKVGTDEISSPLLRDKLQGSVYILNQNPPNLQLLIAASGDGVNLKLVGTVHLDESTGQLTTTFDNTPDIPFSDFKLNFSGGAQAALATPTMCGVYESTTDFTPWSTPFIGDALDTSLFSITSGPLGSPCVDPMPFAPTMTAGATTDQAGGYTSFTMLLQRGDEQQRIKTLSFKTPEGLLGMIAKVSPCPEPQAAQGSCSSASQIGHTVVGAGPGPYPFYIPQAGAPPAPIYLTGPYDGAPFGLSIVVPLIAGPFNLGTEVVRARLDVDPHTSQVTITTNPLPLTEKGIPDDLRLIDAVIDRPEFMFNPTDCAPMSFSGTATSVEGASAALSSHFQMGSCQALKFQPDFKVSTSGRTSRKDGASLTAKIVYPVGNLGFNQASSQSNIQTVKVDLPKQLPSRLPTLQKACTAKQFALNRADCPAASVVGHAKAITPVLPVPLEGPAYFVSHGGEAFPNLVVVLQGDNVSVELVGDTFINEKTNITSSTFKQVPDVPIQSFELNLPEGPYSALAANTNLCKVKGGLKMPTAFTGQNGATIKQNTSITVTGCPKAKKAKPVKHLSKGGKRKHGKSKQVA